MQSTKFYSALLLKLSKQASILQSTHRSSNAISVTLVVCLWACCLISLCLSFLFRKVGTTVVKKK